MASFSAWRREPALVATAALVLVGLAYLLMQLLLVGIHTGYTTDEVVYLSKVNPAVPEQTWTAVRAWGMPILAAPAALFSPGLAVVRIYFSIVWSAGLVLAFLPWRRVLHPAVAPLAALLFATMWITTFYGNAVMPNLPVALGCIAAIGLWAALPTYRHRGRMITLLGVVVGVVALIRPTDSLLLVVPIAAFTVFTNGRARRPIMVALVAGEIVGWLPWVIDAYTLFGGPVHRWHLANSGVQGAHPNLTMFDTYPRLFDGAPGYCCYGASAQAAGAASGLVVAWFIALLILALLGLLVARRIRRLAAVGLCWSVAGAFIMLYVGLLDYGANRFLLPILGLLSIPVALVLVSAVSVAPARGLATLGCMLLVAADLALQGSYDRSGGRIFMADRQISLDVAADTRQTVAHRPCLILVDSLAPVPYYLRCHRADSGSPTTRSEVAAAERRGWSVLAVLSGRGLSPYDEFIRTQGWHRRQLEISGRQRPVFTYRPPGRQ